MRREEKEWYDYLWWSRIIPLFPKRHFSGTPLALEHWTAGTMVKQPFKAQTKPSISHASNNNFFMKIRRVEPKDPAKGRQKSPLSAAMNSTKPKHTVRMGKNPAIILPINEA